MLSQHGLTVIQKLFVIEFQYIVAFGLFAFCLKYSMHSSWHGLQKFVKNLMTYAIPELHDSDSNSFFFWISDYFSLCIVQLLL